MVSYIELTLFNNLFQTIDEGISFGFNFNPLRGLKLGYVSGNASKLNFVEFRARSVIKKVNCLITFTR